MNKERLEKLAKHIEPLSPEKFDMWMWCGTACCIAGHANKLAGHKSTLNEERVYASARKWLELEGEESSRLFAPPAVTGAYNATPKQAAAVIRNLAETGEVEWERYVK